MLGIPTFECPIIYFEQNLVFDNQGYCWGGFKLSGFNYDNLSEDSKIDILNRLTRLIATIKDEAKILIIPTALDLDEHYSRLQKTLDPNDAVYEYAVGHAQTTKEYLKQVVGQTGSNANDYEVYIFVKLVTEDEVGGTDLKFYLDYFFKDPSNAIESYFNTNKKDIMKSRVEHFQKLAEQFLNEQYKRVTMRQATGTEIQFLLKRTFYRGIEQNIKLNLTTKIIEQDGKKTKILSDWTPHAHKFLTRNEKDTVIRPYLRDTINIFKGEISRKKHKRMLTIEQDDGSVSYQTFLVITHIPDEIDFPDNEWIYLLQNLNVQAEICIHIRNIEHREALRKLDMQRREINSQFENGMEANADIPDDLYLGKEDADELENELKASRSPMTKTCVSICLYGTTPEEVERKADFVRETYTDLNFVVERPVADQLQLFYQHIPATSFYTKDFNMMPPPKTLAGGIIGANNQLGDNVGPYIGTTDKLGKQVYLDMGLACRTNESASATIFGRLGKGKSVLANFLTFLNVIYGGFALIFDPQGERAHWFNSMYMLKGMINLVELSSAPENRGKLDPFLVYENDFSSASALALSVISELYDVSKEEDIVLSEAINQLEHVKKPCMAKLCDILENTKQNDELKNVATLLARRIRSKQRIGMAALLFGTGEEKAITLEKRMNIFQIQNLQLPSPDAKRENYTPDEAISVVIMMVLGSFAKKFALTPRNVFKTILFDESWALAKTTEGLKLYDFLSRSGRKFYTGCIFIGHSVLDIPTESLKNTISYKFCFNTKETAEAERMLEYLGMEVTDDNIEQIKSLGNGECFFRDIDGHVGKIKIDVVPEDILNIFKTTPKTREQAEAENTATAFEEEEAAEPVEAGEPEATGEADSEQAEELTAEVVIFPNMQGFSPDIFVREII